MDTTTRKELPIMPLARSMCWHCQSDIGGEYFCGQCVKVQPLSKETDYFTCLELPRKLTLNPAALERTFYTLSRAFHPDFYEGKTEMERAVSLANSALLNQAYRTLKDPIRRAEYLLQLEAGAAKDIPEKAPADLFETILDIQEHLEAFQAATTNDAASAGHAADCLRISRKTLEIKRANMERRLAELFQIWDRLVETHSHEPTHAAHRAQTLQEMRGLLSERAYVGNMLDSLADALGAEALR